MEDKVTVFWHICGINHWREIAADQYATMESSGLLDKSQNVIVTFLGRNRKDVEWLESRNKKIIINNYSPDVNHYERMCLNGLRSWSLNNDGLALYIHAKGVSRVKNKTNVQGWRKMLEFFLVENHERCVVKMGEGFDTLGGNVCTVNRKAADLERPGHSMHYSGNFWWARSAYLRKLPKIPEDVNMQENGNYIKHCEFWLLAPYPKVECGILFKTRLPHYYKSHPESDYKTKGWIHTHQG